MGFEQVMAMIPWVPPVLMIVALGVVVLGNWVDEFQEYTWIYLTISWVIILSSLLVLQFGEDTVLDYYGKGKVVVSEGERYTTVVVPKEDEAIVTNLNYTVNELKDKYNRDYTGERYMDKDDVVEIKLDTTSGYKIVEE